MKTISLWLTALTLGVFSACSTQAEPVEKSDIDIDIELISYPLKIVSSCRDGRAKIFDECSDQLELYKTAQKRAEEEGKVLLVSYGAEWCIWCHVFDKYIRGEHTAFTHTYSKPADKERYTDTMYERQRHDVRAEASNLAKFVADNFVVVHIEYKYSDKSDTAIEASGADEYFYGGLPFIYTVNSKGQFAKAFESDKVETRRDTEDWYRGYDRGKLLKELQLMRDKALIK